MRVIFRWQYLFYVNQSMQCTINLMREIMELFCTGDVNRPTMFFSVGFGSNNHGFNKWLFSRIQASNFGSKDRLYACNFHPQYFDDSCRMCSLHVYQHRVSVYPSIKANDFIVAVLVICLGISILFPGKVASDLAKKTYYLNQMDHSVRPS